MSDFTGGSKMKYPYTITGRLMAFPWRYHWKESRHLRVFTFFTAFAMVPFFWKVQKATNSPGNVAEWGRIRAGRHHDRFALPTEDGAAHH